MPPELREALESAIKETEKDAPPASTPQSEAPASAEPATDLAAASSVESDSQASKDVPASEGAPEKVETKLSEGEGEAADKPASPVTPAGEKADSAVQHRVDRAPQSWKREAKAIWNELPLHVRQEVHRREAQVNQALTEASRNREVVEQFSQITAPYMARLQSMGGTLPAIKNLLQAEYMLATGSREQTAQYMAKLIRDYDVDIATLDSVLAGQVPQQSAQPQQPDISQLVNQQVQQALAPLFQQQQQRQQQVQQEAVMTVEEMSLNPAFPYFEDVREDMADIIEMRAKKGIAMSLEDAYHMAVQMNPATAGQVRHQQVVQTATQQHQQAQRAKAAASSVTGSPASSGSQGQVGDGSLRGAIEAAFGGQRL